MKKLFFSMALLTALSINAQQNLPAATIPTASKAGFARVHPNVTGNWEKEGGDYEIIFKEGGKDMSCIIDTSGAIKETETAIPVSELPASVKASLAKHYKGVKIKEAAAIVKADGMTLYEAEIKRKDVLFDTSGNLIKAKKEND